MSWLRRARQGFRVIRLLQVLAVSALSLHADDPIKPTLNGRGQIEEDGQTYRLLASHRAGGVETEEYGLENQDSANWSELITYQRIALAEPLNADEYVDLLKVRIESGNVPARVRMIRKGTRAAIFGIAYDSADPAKAQLAFVLVTTDHQTQPHEIHVIQYTVQPSRMPPEKLQLSVQRWEARFLRRSALANSDSAEKQRAASR